MVGDRQYLQRGNTHGTYRVMGLKNPRDYLSIAASNAMKPPDAKILLNAHAGQQCMDTGWCHQSNNRDNREALLMMSREQ